jgi:hypothetical protein
VKPVVSMMAADCDSPDKIQGRSHQSPRVTVLALEMALNYCLAAFFSDSVVCGKFLFGTRV